MPRLSDDLDLTYLPVADREKSLTKIDAAMRRLAAALGGGIPRAGIMMSAPKGEKSTKIVVRAGDAQIKIEVTPPAWVCL